MRGELKTKKTELSVQSFIKKIPDEWKRGDTQVILDLMEKTKAKGRFVFLEKPLGRGKQKGRIVLVFLCIKWNHGNPGLEAHFPKNQCAEEQETRR